MPAAAFADLSPRYLRLQRLAGYFDEIKAWAVSAGPRKIETLTL